MILLCIYYYSWVFRVIKHSNIFLIDSTDTIVSLVSLVFILLGRSIAIVIKLVFSDCLTNIPKQQLMLNTLENILWLLKSWIYIYITFIYFNNNNFMLFTVNLCFIFYFCELIRTFKLIMPVLACTVFYPIVNIYACVQFISYA